MATLNLKYAANCKDCGAYLPAGEKARYYGAGKVFGVNCHDKDGNHSDAYDRTRNAAEERKAQQDEAA